MKKQHHKIRRLQNSRIQVHPTKSSIIEEQTNFIQKFRRYIFEIGFIGLVLFLLLVFTVEASRPEIIIDAIEVPEDIEKSGYKGVVVAEKLVDEAHKINLVIRDLSTKNPWHSELINLDEIESSNNSPDISLPIAQSSLRSIARFIRQEFSFNSIYIRGEIVHEKNGISLTLRRLPGANAPPAQQISGIEKIEQLFSEGGGGLYCD